VRRDAAFGHGIHPLGADLNLHPAAACPPEEEKTQCWAVYSIVTDYYIPNTERLRDWISIPK